MNNEKPITSRELIKRCGGDPDAPFEVGPFPPEMRQSPPADAHLGCAECGEEVTVPVDQEHCPLCGAGLWEEDAPADWAINAERAAAEAYASHMGDPDGKDDTHAARMAAAEAIEGHARAAGLCPPEREVELLAEIARAWNERDGEKRQRIGLQKALEEAARVAWETLYPSNPESDWSQYACDKARHARAVCKAIRALATKDGDTSHD